MDILQNIMNFFYLFFFGKCTPGQDPWGTISTLKELLDN